MNSQLSQIIEDSKERFRLFLSIGLGIFMFMLFFEPFSLFLPDLNNRLVFLVGLTGIFFILMMLVYVIISHFFKRSSSALKESVLSSYVRGFMLMVLSSIALTFYLRYVGMVDMSFFTLFKILVISLVPPVTISLHDTIQKLKAHNAVLILAREKERNQVEKYEEDLLSRTIELESEGGRDTFKVVVSNIIYVVSADNYVEIVFKENEHFEKKLMRNTLKNLQLLLSPYSNFIRCHRTCLVNIHYIDQLRKNYNNYWISLKGTDQKLPVSRQYLLSVREVV
ncbi:LytTR family transcriptional regulator DNA-binding domain-containing protein [Marinilabilia sp.]|uniref:LytTR family transcriptional regulator DNA-binding domain-containing protein n=1 Tax=Marinilabilia sp. TaxID=2021252 RepID=UPI0025C17C8D|nr:LytTR family transcriptional regulator DNA-binding domain-containing protein [Marinilabilia sp.]